MDQTGLKWFDLLKNARDYLDSLDREANGLFVYHKFGGRRRFLVASYNNLVPKYLALPQERCHFYEVITAGTPSKLYFDIDIYDAEQQPRWRELVAHLIRYVNHCLKVKYKRDYESTDVIILDSTSTTKFSQHIIYPRVFFRNNLECGYFVKMLADAARRFANGTRTELTQEFTSPKLEQLFIPKGGNDEGTHFIADLTVYTQNRHFRLLRSSKLNVEVPLLLADENKYAYVDNQDILFASMVTCHTDPNDLLTCEQPAEQIRPYRNKTTTSTSVDNSNHVYLDNFVLRFIQSHEKHMDVKIDKIIDYSDGSAVLYSIRGSKWCQNVNREHSENRPYYCANLKKMNLYQMCNSFKCRGYRSPDVEIPNDILAKMIIGDEEELLKLMEETEPMLVI